MFQKNCCNRDRLNLKEIMMSRPDAIAEIKGSSDYPDISGTAKFYQTEMGVVVMTEVFGLPRTKGACQGAIFGYHIHSGQFCTGNRKDAFADAQGHYTRKNCEHPFHAGDMPPLFGNNGYAFSVFLSSRFCVCEVIGRTVIIHLHPDDFHSQPAGDAGTKIACGEIKKYRK